MEHVDLNTSINLTHSVACVESVNARSSQRAIASPPCGSCCPFVGQQCPGGYGGTRSVGAEGRTSRLNELVQSQHMKQ